MLRYIYSLRTSLSLVLTIGISLSLPSCRKDISEETLNILVPVDGFQTEIRTIQFKWEELEDAEFYQLQIVEPSFDSTAWFIVDSTISGTEFTFTLDPGTYEWRVRAENGGSMTSYTSPRTLIIDSTNDLTGQTINLYLPSAGAYTNNSNPSFTWETIDIADEYIITIKEGSNWTTGQQVIKDTVSNAGYSGALNLTEAQHMWGVYAINGMPSASDESVRSFSVDLTTPGAPTNLSPDGSTFFPGSTITYQWTRAIDNGVIQSPLMDSVFIYSDVGLNNLYQRFETSSTSRVDSISTSGTFYWYVKSFDEAGNIGPISNVAQITIQ